MATRRGLAQLGKSPHSSVVTPTGAERHAIISAMRRSGQLPECAATEQPLMTNSSAFRVPSPDPKREPAREAELRGPGRIVSCLSEGTRAFDQHGDWVQGVRRRVRVIESQVPSTAKLWMP